MPKNFSVLYLGAAFLVAMLPLFAHAQITVEAFQTSEIAMPNQGTEYTLAPSFDVADGDFLVVGVTFEGDATSSMLSFDGMDVPLVTSSNNGGDQTAIFVLDGVSGSGPLMFTLNDVIGFPGFYAASLSGAAGVETFGAVNTVPGPGDFNVTVAGASAGSYVLGAYTDQLGAVQFTDVSGDLDPVHEFGGASGDIIGSAIGAVVTGFGNGSDLSATFTDTATPEQAQNSPAFQNRSNFSYVAIEAADDAGLVGDVNCDGVVDLLDVGPFVELLTQGGFSPKADINGDGEVTLLDIAPFVDLILGN